MYSHRKRTRVGVVFRALLGTFVIAALATDVIDPWIVPIVDRPYAVYRADFVDDVDDATNIGALAGSLAVEGDALNVRSWLRHR